MKISTRIVSLVLAIFLFINIGITPAKAAGRELKQGIAFVDASALRLRSAPNTTSATLAFAYDNEVVVIMEKTGLWYKVNYNLQTGYMHSDYLNVTTRENAELGYGKVNGSNVNIRSGPGTGYPTLTRASTGNKVYIIGINNQWFKVIYGNHIGYICSDYVDLTEIPYENRNSANKPLFFIGGKSTGVKPSADALKQPTTTTGSKIVATAKKILGCSLPLGWQYPQRF